MREVEGPESGLLDDALIKAARTDPIKNPTIKRREGYVEIHDTKGVRAIMKEDDFAKIEEKLQK